MTRADDVAPAEPSPWRERAVARSLKSARSRAEQRVQRYLDAAFSIIDEKGTTEFTIQEVVDRSGQSLRGFYECFDGKDELVLALFEETVGEALADIRAAVDAEKQPLDRLRAFAITLHEWCDPTHDARPRGGRRRHAIADFSIYFASAHADRVRVALAPQAQLLRDLIEAAAAAGAIRVADARRATTLVAQTVMYNSFGNRRAENPKQRLTADETWEFCLRGLGG